MKLPKQNRFQKADGKRAVADSSSGGTGAGVLFLVVTGLVTYENEQPSSVIVFGVKHNFEAGNRVTIAGRTYQLMRADDGEERLIPL